MPLPDDVAYLHASWRRSDPCPGWGPDLQTNSPETNVPNLSDAHNYLVLETEGQGHYVGCNLSVFHRQGSWWGEGDDMIMIDDDTWPPSLHGTGTEDYFNHAWGMQNRAYPYHGAIIHEGDVPGYSVSYRFHGPDPVRFAERIRVSIEHGHANHLADDWASTAYWYQLPPRAAVTIQPLAERLPTRPVGDPAPAPQRPAGRLAQDVSEARAVAQPNGSVATASVMISERASVSSARLVRKRPIASTRATSAGAIASIPCITCLGGTR